jgi:hypothetical protein
MQHLFKLTADLTDSGLQLECKVDCNAVSHDDLTSLAYITHRRLNLPWGAIGRVIGMPPGGLRFAAHLYPYLPAPGSGPITLIVDDIATTSKFEEFRMNHNIPNAIGLVLFARGPLPSWVQATLEFKL